MSPLLIVSLITFQTVFAPGIAMVWGGAPERLIAGAFWTDSFVTFLIMIGHHDRYYQPEMAVAAADMTMLIVVVMIAIRANRWWPIWFAACHSIGLLAHFGRMMNPAIHFEGYRAMAAYVAYPLWGLIIVGSVGHELRIRRYGNDLSWKNSLRV